MSIKEQKFEITEELHCRECGRRYVYDLFWHRQYNIKVGESPINTKAFHSLCSKHKLANYAPELAWACCTGRIDDRDVEKMGLSLEELLGYY